MHNENDLLKHKLLSDHSYKTNLQVEDEDEDN